MNSVCKNGLTPTQKKGLTSLSDGEYNGNIRTADQSRTRCQEWLRFPRLALSSFLRLVLNFMFLISPLLIPAEGSHTFAGMLGQHSPTKMAVASLYSFVMQAGATPALSTKCQVSMHI